LKIKRYDRLTEASVNTVVTIIERCDNASERDSHLAKFVKVKKPLVGLIPGDPVIEAFPRLARLRDLVAHVEQAGRKYIKTHPIGMVTEEDDNFRIRILRQSEMLAEVQKGRKTVKWGRYLRAPQVYFDIVEHGKVCLLGAIAVPKFGSKTRINEFFHVTPETATQFGIEVEYLWPLIKSPKDTNTIKVDPADLTLRIFVCRRSKTELKKLGHKGSLKYIEWGEQQTYTTGTFKRLKWPQGTWVAKREPGWYALPNTEINVGQVFMSEAFGEAHIHRFCPQKLVPDKRLYFLEPSTAVSDAEDVAAVLNCSITGLSLEVSGRVTMGDGVLEYSVEDARDYLFVPDIRSATQAQIKRMRDSFEVRLQRPIQAVRHEIECRDTQSLDKVMLTAIGLDPKKYLKPIYEGLCELVRERIELGQTRGKARKTKSRGVRAEKKATEEVLDEVLPDGPKRFPNDFFSSAATTAIKTPIELPEAPLIFDNSPLFAGVHTSDNSFSLSVKTPAEGKFLLYAHGCGHRTAALPEKVVEVSRTVANYEQYLRDLRKQFYEAYYRRTLDTRTAARLTQAAFHRFHLPNVEG